MYCQTAAPAAAPQPAAAAKVKAQCFVRLAKRKCGIDCQTFGQGSEKTGVRRHNRRRWKRRAPAALAQERCALIVTSTWGEGDPPDNAVQFWEQLTAENELKLASLNYSVLALGDTNYQHFCGFGKNLDSRLEALGAKRIFDRIDCNVDFEEGAARWQTGVFEALKKIDPSGAVPGKNGSGNGAAPVAGTSAGRGKASRLLAQKSVFGPVAREPQTDRGRLRKRHASL